MAEGYKVRLIGAVNVDRRFKKLRSEPELIGNANREIGEALVSDLIGQAHAAGISPFEMSGGILTGGIRYEHVQSHKGGYLLMPEHAVYLDSMNPHFVSIDASRPELLAWALQASSGAINNMAAQVITGKRKSFSVLVTPHPFISDGITHTQQRVMGILKRHTAQITE